MKRNFKYTPNQKYCCRNCSGKDWRKDYPEKMKNSKNNWNKANSEKAQARHSSEKFRKQRPDKSRENILKTRYGITLEEKHIMYENQEHKCAICKGLFNEDQLYIDHVHVEDYSSLCVEEKKKCIRGLLCRKCNSGIGMLKDNADIVRNALEYLLLGVKQN